MISKFTDKKSSRMSCSNISSLEGFLRWVAKAHKTLNYINTSPMHNEHFELFFRGISDARYENIPSIFRNEVFLRNEEYFLNECLANYPQEFQNEKNIFDILVKMQHYGFPTRLLDITKDPLVALYFASRNNSKNSKNGKVVAYFVGQHQILYADSPVVQTIANLAHQKDKTIKDILSAKDRKKRNEKLSPGTLELIDTQKVLCVKPNKSNERIVRQNGSFLIFGSIFTKDLCPTIISAKDLITIYRAFMAIRCRALKPDFMNGDFSFEEKMFKHYPDFYENQWKQFHSRLSNDEDCINEFMKITFDYFSDKRTADLTYMLQIMYDEQQRRMQNFMNNKKEPAPNIAPELQRLSHEISVDNAILDIMMDRGTIAQRECLIHDKKKIQNQLQSIGITKNRLFPELEIFANTLKENCCKIRHCPIAGTGRKKLNCGDANNE